MTAFVTGGDRLRRRPRRARAAREPGGACAAWCGRRSDAALLAALAVDRDRRRRDRRGVRSGSGMAGCDEVFHCAADYRLYARDPAEIYRTNVEGTRIVLARGRGRWACGASSTPARSRRWRRAPTARPSTNAPSPTLDDMIGDYKRSKLLAEREVEAACARGLPVVVVSPVHARRRRRRQADADRQDHRRLPGRPVPRLRRHRPQPDRRARRRRRRTCWRPSAAAPASATSSPTPT